MEFAEMLLMIAATAVNRYDVLKVCMAWADVHWGFAVGLVLVAIPLIIGWDKLQD